MLQVLLVNMIPYNLLRIYYSKKISGWRYRRVRTFDTSIFAGQGVLVLLSWVIGLTVYNAGTMFKAVPDKNFIS